jgi:hypothetical protein
MRASGSGMKAQAVFEFIIASLLMFAIVIYTISYLSSAFAAHHEIATTADLESKAMRVSDMLTGDTDVGIFSLWPELDKGKMQGLNNSCDGNDGYFYTLDRLGLNETYPAMRYNRLYILASSKDGDIYIDCGRVPVEDAASGQITRFGYVPGDGKLANITVTVW